MNSIHWKAIRQLRGRFPADFQPQQLLLFPLSIIINNLNTINNTAAAIELILNMKFEKVFGVAEGKNSWAK